MFNLIIIKVAFRNIFLYRMKTLIIGSILVFGAFLAILGNSIVDAIASGMKNSLTQSVTGDLQIYSKNAKDKLSVFGGMDGGPSDVGYVPDFKLINEKLKNIDNIKAIVPLGTNFAMMNPGNLIDVEVEKLRNLYKNKKIGADVKVLEEIKNSKEHLKFLIQDVFDTQESNKDSDFLTTKVEDQELNKTYLRKALSAEFWQQFDGNFENQLEFIANKVAPLLVDENMLYFNYLGTNPELFKKNFEQFEIVKGEMIPEGKKGFLIHDFVYENLIKHRIARRLDAIKKEMKDKKTSIESSKDLQDKVKANLEQLAEIYLQLNPAQIQKLNIELSDYLKSPSVNGQDDLSKLKVLLTEFFKLDDKNFEERYKIFYEHIAPIVQLYKIKIGDIIPLTAFTKLGSSSAVNIKVYGTFRFKSFENSPLAGNFSLVDLVSFRQLYGFLTEERKKQNKEMEAEMGTKDLSKEDLESMFGSVAVEKKEVSKVKIPQAPMTNLKSLRRIISDHYTKEELENGIFINAAVFLKDATKLAETLNAIHQISEKENLNIQASDWQEASGVVGQLTFALKFVLYFFVFILLSIASMMIMNSLLMATMDRQQEIGTMRAIGAPKAFIYKVFLFETFLTSLLFGGIGTALALIIIVTLGKVGIPASGDVAMFFFSGPRLYFYAHLTDIFAVFGMMLLISFLATQYPAWRAMKISPILAMQKKD